MLTEDTIVPSTEEPIPVATPEFQEQAPQAVPEQMDDLSLSPENDINSDEYDIPMQEIQEEVPNFMHGDGKEVLQMPPPEAPTLAPVAEREANERAFYTTKEIGSEDMERDYDSTRNQLMTEGRSDLEDQARAEAAASDEESDQLAVESIVSDSSIPMENRKTAVKR